MYHARLASDLATKTEIPNQLNRAHQAMATAALYNGDMALASHEIEAGRKYQSMLNSHNYALLGGMVLARTREIEAARKAFDRALEYCHRLLDDTPALFSPKYGKGLAFAGLAILGQTEQNLASARAAYAIARESCDGPGVLAWHLLFLQHLAPIDPFDRLTGLRALFQ